MTNNDPERLIRLSRWSLGVLLLLLFVFWQCVAPPTNRSEIAATPIPIPIQVLPLPIVSPAVATPTPTAQAAEKLPTLAGTRTPTPTFTPMPSATPTVTPARSPVMRG